MPELPEVETIARELQHRLAGATLGRVKLSRTDIVHGDPRPLSKTLPGRSVRAVRRRAKRLILDLQPTAQLLFHLGMSGRLTLVPRRQPLEKHTHLCIAIRGGPDELRFRDPRRFGGVWLLAGGDRHVGRRLSTLGPEPLPLTPSRFRDLLDRRRQIKALLLDQRAIAGLGNIYCDEALHAAGVHPLTPAGVLDAAKAGRLLRAIKSVLNRAIRFNGSTLLDYRQADGTEGSFQNHHRVYNREGKRCCGCGATIVRIPVAGRSSFVCPACQPAP